MATEPTTARTVLPGAPPFSVDDLLKFPDDGNRYELFNGSLLVSPAPTPLHQLAITRALHLLQLAAPPELEPLSTVNLRVSPDSFYIPDLVVVAADAIESVELMFAPEHIRLAVEIVSPSTKIRDRGFKAEAYAAAKISLYWRIELDEGPSLYVYELDGDDYGPPVAYKAGAAASPASPFPVTFDPGDLVGRRARP